MQHRITIIMLLTYLQIDSTHTHIILTITYTIFAFARKFIFGWHKMNTHTQTSICVYFRVNRRYCSTLYNVCCSLIQVYLNEFGRDHKYFKATQDIRDDPECLPKTLAFDVVLFASALLITKQVNLDFNRNKQSSHAKNVCVNTPSVAWCAVCDDDIC